MKKMLLILCTLLSHPTFTHNTIFEDVRARNKESIKQRLENCENCAIKDENGNNALHIAAQEGAEEIIDILTTPPSYDNWSDWFYAWLYAPTLPSLDVQNDDGDSPLHYAVDREKLTTAEQLVKKGARMEVVNKKGLSAPFLAVLKDDPRFIKIFVAHQLNLEKHKRNGDTVFHAAIKEKKPKSIHYCINETALHNLTNNEDKTPTFLAIDRNIDTLRVFKQSQLNAATATGIKPIHYATEHNKYDAITYLLNHNISIDEPDTQGNTPIFYVNNEATLNFLLAHNANLHKRNNKGEDILAVASHNKNLPLIKVLTQKHNFNIDARDNKGQTPFMSATIEQNYEVMTTLINQGVNIRITDNARETVLHKIARSGDQKAAKIVLNHEKALLTDLNKDGNSPLFIAIQNGNMTFADFLIDAGSCIDTINNNGDSIIHELIKKNNRLLLNKLLRRANADIINHKNKKDQSPLLLAVHYDDIETVKILINHQAHIYTLDKYGNNIAHIAAGSGKMNVLTFLQSQRELFRSRNNQGETPFVYAAQRGQLETIKLFLQNEDHFINGDVSALANTMRNAFLDYDQRKVCDFLAQQHKNRLLECLKIVDIEKTTINIIREKNNLSKTLFEKTSQPYHPESLNLYYSENDLYKMTQTERNKVKNICLERQNRELTTKNTLEQKLHAIAMEEQRKTTIAQQKAELERIAADRERAAATQYAADIAAHQQRITEEPEHSPVEPAVVQAVAEASCCICFEDNLQLLKRIPCKNRHSDHICGACLQAPSVKTCPICRGSLTK
jgi:ankyrin repeat protein